MSAAAASIAAPPPPSSSYELLGAKEAALFYEDACRREGLYIHSTFLKQLLMGSVLIQFENGYLGGNGISPIVQTLQRIPMRALLLSKCALSSDDIRLLCAGLMTHPVLEKIDVRGVDLTIGAVKELLHLAARNTHITEILMDKGLPKFVAVQQQCERNSLTAKARTSECVFCGAAVSVEARASCETLVLRFVLEHLKLHTRSISAAAVTVLFSALQLCMDRNDGILSVCGEVCGEALAEDLCLCVRSVSKALEWKVPYDLPMAPFLRTFLAHQQERFQRDAHTVDTPSTLCKSFFQSGPVDARAEECWRTKKPRSDIDVFFDNCADRDVSTCTICGQPGVCSTDGPTWLLRTLQIDVEKHGAAITPASLLRLCRMFTVHACTRPCSRRCLRHLVRYALYGYGGVNCSLLGGFPPLTSVLGSASELQRLPLVDFAVVDTALETVHDVDGEEINCAVTVASALSDMDGVAMDPYLLFSIGRHLRKMPPGSIGMDLAIACETVRLVGCLPEEDAPYKRSDGNTDNVDASTEMEEAPAPRDLVADWPAWSTASGEATVKKWLHSAFAHRRQRVCAIDGPHRDLFDNIRAALWALRQQNRSILVTIKVSVSWLSLKDGVVLSTASCHTHGFCTTAKVVGQSTRANTVYLILQCPLGRHIGHNGFLYVPKTVFLLCVRGMALVFVDAITMEYRTAGWRASLYAKELVGPTLGVPRDACLQRLRQLFSYTISYAQGRKHVEGAAWKLVGSRVPAEVLQHLFNNEHLPAALTFLRDSLTLASLDITTSTVLGDHDGNLRGEARDVCRAYWKRILLSSRYPSQLLFYFNEVLDSGRWLQQALETAVTLNAKPASAAPLQLNATDDNTEFESTPLAEGTTVQLLGANSEGRDETGDTRTWRTLRSVPSLRPLPREPISIAEAVTTEIEVPSPMKIGRRGGSLQSTTTEGSLAAEVLRTSHAAKPPLAPPTTQPSSRRRASGSPSPSNVSVPQSPGLSLTSLSNPFTDKPAHATEKPTTTTATVVSPNVTAVSQGKLHQRLQKGWRDEQTLRNALLEDAAGVGVVEFLRTRAQTARLGKPLSSEIKSMTSNDAHATNDDNGSISNAPLNPDEQDSYIPAHLLGKPWFVVPVQLGERSDDGAAVPPADLHLLFIGNSFSLYSMRESRLLCSPTLMSKDVLTATFPFVTGVDAVTLHPTNADLVFFFSGREWLLFDLKLMECVDGPYLLSTHGQFRKLPAVFHEGVDSVIAIPNSSMLVFFRSYSYVVFDVVTRRCIGGVGRLRVPLSCTPDGDTPDGGVLGSVNMSLPKSALSSKEVQSASSEPADFAVDSSRSAAAELNNEPNAELEGGDTVADGDTQGNSCALSISPMLQRLLGTSPMSWFTTRNSVSDATATPTAATAERPLSHWLVNRRGEVVEVGWELKAHGDSRIAAGDENRAFASERATPQWVVRCRDRDPTVSTLQIPFAHLPAVFRQSSPGVLSALCALAVKKNFALEDVHREAADSGSSDVENSGTSSPSWRLEMFDPECGRRTLLTDTLAGFAVTARASGAESSTTMNSSPPTNPNRTSGDDDNVHDISQTVITSSLVSTPLAKRMPLALSRNGPVMGSREVTDVSSPVAECVCGDWEREVFFHGEGGTESFIVTSKHGYNDKMGKETSSGGFGESLMMDYTPGKVSHQRHFIEYDLGPSAPRRSFVALLLILDTSLLPSAVLQLSPLTASIECSVEGEVYVPRAVLRITGPVTAARWGGSPHTVEPGVARFWRLCFHTTVPAAVGFVRLFWFEVPHGQLRHGKPSVPLPLCVALPLEVREADDNHPFLDEDARASAGSGAPAINIEAGCVVALPKLLLNSENALPVLVDNPSVHARGWYGHHTTCPLLGRYSSTYLICCDSSFIEVSIGMSSSADGDDGESRERHAVPFPSATVRSVADHPSFASLPCPFALGWDANFYPSPHEQPELLCLIRGDAMLLLDVEEGKARGNVVAWRHSALLEGLSETPVAHVIATVNCWSCARGSVIGFFYEPSSVSVSCEVQYLEFDVERNEIVYGPVKLASHVRSRYGALLPSPSVENTLLSVLCSPQAPSTLYLFYEKVVQVLSEVSPGATRASLEKNTGAVAMTESPVFYTIPLLLPKWGTRQRHCHITLDVASLLRSNRGDNDDNISENEGALVAGMQFVSSGGRKGCTTCWQVQCSENGSAWEDVAVHRQNSGERVVSETMWMPRGTGCCNAARFWRFKRVSCVGGSETSETSRDNNDDCLQSYSQLRLLSIPRRRCIAVPVRVSGTDVNASSTDACNAFFTEGTRAAKLVLKRQPDGSSGPRSAASRNAVYELVWDYGLALVVLSGVTFILENKLSNTRLTWALYGSSAIHTAQWTSVASVTVSNDATSYSLSWVPNGPYRYWRLVCVATGTPINNKDTHECPETLLLSAFRAYEYEGPLVSLQSSTGAQLNATSLLWPSNCKATAAHYNLASSINSNVHFSRVVEALTWCKIDFLISGDCTATMVMEWSADAAEWFTAAFVTLSFDDAATKKVQQAVLSWQNCGPRSLWRIRVLAITSDVTFLPLRLYLGTSPAEYVMKLSSKESLLDATTQLQLAVATSTVSHRSSMQVAGDRPLSAASSVSMVAAAAATPVNDATAKKSSNAVAVTVNSAESTVLCLEAPQRLIGVCAALPTVTSRYAVEYLGLDGASWIAAAVLEGSANPHMKNLQMLSANAGWTAKVAATAVKRPLAAPQGSNVHSVWWDGASVSPSAQWRLRPLLKAGDGLPPSYSTQLQVNTVEWFADVGTTTVTVDTSTVAGLLVSTTGFIEVRPPSCLSGTDRAKGLSVAADRRISMTAPVLQCTVAAPQHDSLTGGSAICTVTWSFISPILLDQLFLQLRATLQPPATSDEQTDMQNTVVSPISPVMSDAAVQNLWVETSDNGEDFVAVAHGLWRLSDATVTLTWEEVPPAAFWRLRLSKVSTAAASPLLSPSSSSQRDDVQYLLEIFAARWGVRRSCPALTSDMHVASPGRFTNTAYRAWLTDRFNCEDAFMRDCQDALDEARSAESKLRTRESMSAPAIVAAAVQKMRTKYQAFIQKTAKEAARQFRLHTEDGKSKASPTGIVPNPRSANSDGARALPSFPPSMPHRAHVRWLSPERASADVMWLLLESAASPLLGGKKLMQLAELVNCPLAFREAFKFTKKPMYWFYPCLEVVGQLAQEWYGFSADKVCASFCVYWSLSSALQRRKDVLLAPEDVILPLSEHVASPLVVVQINELNWSPSHHFPSVPFLYATNFNDRPTTVVFALNNVVFTPPYALGLPSAKDSRPLTSPYPYTVYAGVNFVQARPLSSCPAPVFDVLRYILPPSLFRPLVEEKAGKTLGHRRSNNSVKTHSSLVLMVLTTPSLQQSAGSGADRFAAQLRFTVPADGVNFGLRRLVMDTLEFEITMKAEGPASRWTYQTTFVSHNARFSLEGSNDDNDSGVSTEVPVSLLGHVEVHGLPVVALRGSLGNARITAVVDIPGAIITNLSFHTVAQVEKVPPAAAGLVDDEVGGAAAMIAPRWNCFPLESEGQVTLPGMPHSCSCTCILSSSTTAEEGALKVSQLQVALQCCPLSDVQMFCRACGGGASAAQIAEVPALPSKPFDMCGMQVQLAAFLKVSVLPRPKTQGERSRTTLHGQGLLYLDNIVLHDATVEMACATQSVTVMASCAHPLRFGGVVLEGTEEHPISVQLLLSASELSSSATQRAPQPQQHGRNSNSSVGGGKPPYTSHRLLVAGPAYIFGRKRFAQVSLELSRNPDGFALVTLIGHSFHHSRLEAIVQDSAVSLAWRYAQITVDESAFRHALVRELGSTPILAALRAHGIPLACVVSSVTAAPFDLITQRLSLRVKGILLGASFDVVTSTVCPDDAEDVWSMLAAQLCPEVVEQCEENLWASYANVVGYRARPPQDGEEA